MWMSAVDHVPCTIGQAAVCRPRLGTCMQLCLTTLLAAGPEAGVRRPHKLQCIAMLLRVLRLAVVFISYQSIDSVDH